MRGLLLAFGLASLSCQAGTIYMCKGYGGGTFWSSAHCNQHSALIEKIVSVPDGLPFDQQVALAEQQRAAAASTTTNVTATNGAAAQNTQSECTGLDAHIASLDAMARQPQSGQTQDWISAQRRKARDRQFAIRCR